MPTITTNVTDKNNTFLRQDTYNYKKDNYSGRRRRKRGNLKILPPTVGEEQMRLGVGSVSGVEVLQGDQQTAASTFGDDRVMDPDIQPNPEPRRPAGHGHSHDENGQPIATKGGGGPGTQVSTPFHGGEHDHPWVDSPPNYMEDHGMGWLQRSKVRDDEMRMRGSGGADARGDQNNPLSQLSQLSPEKLRILKQLMILMK
jgi:hypothetical protein